MKKVLVFVLSALLLLLPLSVLADNSAESIDNSETVVINEESLNVPTNDENQSEDNIVGLVIAIVLTILLVVAYVGALIFLFIKKREFLSDNASIISKFMITHIVMSVMGIMVGLAIISIDRDTQGISLISVLATVFTAGYMCFMHYDDMFFFAVKEGIRMRADGRKPDLLKGLKLTLISYSPVLLIGLIWIVVDVFAGEIENFSPIVMLIYYGLQGSFLSVAGLQSYIGVIGYVALSILPALIAGSIAYTIGVQDKTLRGMMGMNVPPPFDGPLERKPKNKDKK